MSSTGSVAIKSKYEILGLEAMREFAHLIATQAGDRLLLLLNGPMGAGKTQFTRFFVEALGSDEASSPSFAIHNTYSTLAGPIDHMDLFRLESEDDLESTGFWDFFRERRGIVIVEWANRLHELGLEAQLPRTWPTLEMTFEVPAVVSDQRTVLVSALNFPNLKSAE